MQPLVVGQQQSPLAAADDLVGGDAEATQVSERAHVAALVLRPRRLGAVLDHFEAMLACNGQDRVHVGHGPHDARRRQGHSPRRDRVARSSLGPCPATRQRRRRRARRWDITTAAAVAKKPDGRHDHFGARADSGGHERGVQRPGPRTTAHRVFHAEDFSGSLLEGRALGGRRLRGEEPRERGAGPQVCVGDRGADAIQRFPREAEPLGNRHELLDSDLRALRPVHLGKGLRSALDGQLFRLLDGCHDDSFTKAISYPSSVISLQLSVISGQIQ